MFGTTKGFLDYFSLKKLDDLPPLADLADWETLRVQLNLPDVEGTDGSSEVEDEIEGLAALSVEGSAEEIAEEIAEDAEETSEEDSEEEADAEADGEAETDIEEPETDVAEGKVTTDLPVLYPEGGDEPSEEDELAVSKWPEPVG